MADEHTIACVNTKEDKKGEMRKFLVVEKGPSVIWERASSGRREVPYVVY